MSDTTPTPIQPPQMNLPFLGPNGTVSLPWYRFFQQLGLNGGGTASLAALEAEIEAAEAEAALAKTDAEAALTLAESLSDIINEAEVLSYVAMGLGDTPKPVDFNQVLPYLALSTLDNAAKPIDFTQILPFLALAQLDVERLQVLSASVSVLHDVKSINFAGPPVASVTAVGKNITATFAAVTSVALALPSSVFTISGSPVTTTGTLTGSFATQTANYVFAGPASGAAAVPTFRALAAADITGLAALAFQQNGTAEGSAATLNFATGTVAVSGGVATYTPSGGGGLPSIASGDTLANLTGSSATPTGVTVSAMLDYVFTAAQGDILYRGASTWAVLAPGTSGLYLQTQGASANPQWASASTTLPSINSGDLLGNSTAGPAVASDTTLTALLDRNFSSPGQGAVVYRGASTYAGLGAGTSGQALCTQGASANPHWATPALPSINSGDLLGNSTAGPAVASDTTLSALLDRNFSTPGQGAIIYRGASVWTDLGPSSNVGDLLRSGGSSANVSWTTPVTTTSGSVVVSALPSASLTGYIRVVSDSTVVPAGNSGATVAGGGSHVCMVWANGSNWLIV